jgi:hypothetical protein
MEGFGDTNAARGPDVYSRDRVELVPPRLDSRNYSNSANVHERNRWRGERPQYQSSVFIHTDAAIPGQDIRFRNVPHVR